MRFIRRTFILFLLVCAAVAARAQAVHWENGDSSLGSVVQLVFEDCEPDGDPQLPAIPNATLSFAGTSTTMNVVNMSVSRTTTLSYIVQARRGGPLQIPGFTVKTNKGPLKVAAFNGSAPAVSADSVASAKLVPERTTVWAGEVFGLTYELTAARRNNPQVTPTFDWNPAPLVAEDWSKYELSENVVNGQREAKLTYRTRAYAKVPNTVKLEAATQLIQVQTGSASFGLFTQPRMEPVSVTSDQPTIEVRPLPTAPAGFTGAVGHFKLTSKVVPKDAAVGEPVTWTLELSGTGNWPDVAGLPSRDVSKDFQVVQPKAKRTTAEGKLFDATLAEDVVLVPTKTGQYTLGPVAFTFFNPQTGSYETVRTERVTVNITAAALSTATGPITIGTSSAQAPQSTEAKPHPVPPAPAAPASIPGQPFTASATASLPLTTKSLVVWLSVPWAALVLLWLALAARRAKRTDPLRAQRAAHARLAALLARLRTGAGRPDAAALLEWQHDATVLLRIPHAAPSATALEAAADAEWATLWREADRSLYGADHMLPSDWVARAETALEAKRIAGFNPLRLFLPQNLLAFAASLAVLAVLSPSLHGATPAPDVNYRAGNFEAAEKAWRETATEHPLEWTARYNLSLALTQQDKNGEAAAQAAAAFVQHPNHPAVRRQFIVAADKAGFAPAALQVFLREGPTAAIATAFSPAGWQRVLIASAFLVAGAVAWLLINSYGPRSKLQSWTAGVVAGCAILLGLVSIYGVVAYGETADRRAVITWQTGTLRSIPTEADTTQKTTALSAGSVAIVDKTFLGWDRLVFANGQTGWVRKEEVVPLWR